MYTKLMNDIMYTRNTPVVLICQRDIQLAIQLYIIELIYKAIHAPLGTKLTTYFNNRKHLPNSLVNENMNRSYMHTYNSLERRYSMHGEPRTTHA